MLRVLTSEEMRRVDRHATEDIGIPGSVLMESAGRCVFAHMRHALGEIHGKRFAVFCGPGNNGGDGFVVARYLKLSGANVDLFLVGAKRPSSEDGLRNFRVAQKLGLKPVSILTRADLARQMKQTLGWEGVVDALFGTGLVRPLRAPFLDVVQWIRRIGAPVWSVDLPSGLSSDTGEAMGEAVRAKYTITLGFKKRGLFLNDGPEFAGEVLVADLSLSDAWVEDTGGSKVFESEAADFSSLLPKRRRVAHKGSFGHVLVVAGSPQKSGAAVLTSRAALRTGAGLVTLAVPRSAHRIVKSQLVEVMTEPLKDDGEGILDEGAIERLVELAKGKSVMAVGPGLLPGKTLTKILTTLFEETKIPVILDADGLNTFGSALPKLGKLLSRFVLTPHPGEMARLVGRKTDAVQKDRLAVAREFSDRTKSIVVLKGAFSVVALPSGDVFFNPTGNSGMATAGMGDVLTGIIAGLVVQGVSLPNAALAGVFYHGVAGDRAAARIGSRGLLAGDLIEELPRLFIS